MLVKNEQVYAEFTFRVVSPSSFAQILPKKRKNQPLETSEMKKAEYLTLLFGEE